MPSTDRQGILCFDTTLPPASACLGDGAALIASSVLPPETPAGDALAGLVARLVEQHGHWDRVGLIATTIGPGGFTSVRVGVATARALALALGCPVLPVGTLNLIAARLPPAPRLAIVQDVHRGQVVRQDFGHGRPAGEPRLLDRAGVIAELRAENDLVLGGDPLPEAPDLLVQPPPAGEATWAETLLEVVLARLAEGEKPVSGSLVRPYYQRPPDARPSGSSLRVDPAGR